MLVKEGVWYVVKRISARGVWGGMEIGSSVSLTMVMDGEASGSLMFVGWNDGPFGMGIIWPTVMCGKWNV